MIIQKEANELINQINHIRDLMILTGLRSGLNDDQTLKYSKELDKLIHKYQLMTSFSSYTS